MAETVGEEVEAAREVIDGLRELATFPQPSGWRSIINRAADTIESLLQGQAAAREEVIPDNKPDLSGLDDGPYLPGRAPRKKPPRKTPEEMRAIRAKAWATRRSPPHHGGEEATAPVDEVEEQGFAVTSEGTPND